MTSEDCSRVVLLDREGCVVLTDAEAMGESGYRGCGVGEGADCCAYLVIDGDGFKCARSSATAEEIRWRVAAGAFTSQRLPQGPLLACQSEGRRGG